nr:hypothetical protein [Photobacterium leiognathi]
MNNLTDEIQLGLSQAKLKNRIVVAPMTIQSAFFDGGVTQETIGYYAARFEAMLAQSLLKVRLLKTTVEHFPVH